MSADAKPRANDWESMLMDEGKHHLNSQLLRQRLHRDDGNTNAKSCESMYRDRLCLIAQDLVKVEVSLLDIIQALFIDVHEGIHIATSWSREKCSAAIGYAS